MSSVRRQSRVDEDDDLDDLDDVLDQFAPPAQTATAANLPTAASASTSSTQPATDAHEELSDELAAEFAREMESLLAGLKPDPPSEGITEQERLAAAWEAMLVEGMNAMSNPLASTPPADPSSSQSTEDSFQSRIRSTMNRLRESESGLQPSDTSASADGDPLQSLLSQLQGLGNISGDDTDGEDKLQKELEAMMGQLMSKDVLYEPLKELHEKFPGYIAEHASTISPQDKVRFEAQTSCIRRLLDIFEAPTYRDDDEKAREGIVDLMSELQSHGSPPEEIMGPLPPGFSLGADGLPNLPDGCNVN